MRRLTLAALFFSATLSAQYNLPLDRDVHNAYERALNSRFVNAHTAIKPLREAQVRALSDSTPGYEYTDSRDARAAGRNDSLPQKSNNDIGAHVIADLRGGYDLAGKASVLRAFGGLALHGDLRGKLAVEARFGAGTTTLPAWLDSFAQGHHVLPGWGDRLYTADSVNYSWQHASGYLSWSPNKVFNFQAGRDKHFWGEGYRSLFLSDVSGAYPFLKVSATVWKLQYTSLFAVHNDMTAPSGAKADFRRKYGSFHYISWNATKRLNLSLFEAVVWQGADDNRFRGFDPNYLNPVIFFRPVEYSLGSSDNAMLGFAFKVKAAKGLQLYGQIILDEFFLKEIKAQNGWWANKQGGQLGFKGFNLFKVQRLNIQGEVNVVRPYTYAHGSVQQNYGHANQALAHPQGANFAEAAGFLNYRWKRWLVEGKTIWCRYGQDTAGLNYGRNIFMSYLTRPSDYGNKLFQGLQTDLLQLELRGAFLLYPPMNVKLEAGFIARTEKTALRSDKNAFVWIGLRTALFNDYSDF